MQNSQPPSTDWYNPADPQSSYIFAVCRWGAGVASASKAMGALFERLAEFQVDVTRDLARASKDPTSAMQSYGESAARMMQMQSELQVALENIVRDADLLYEEIRREVDGVAPQTYAAPDAVDPAMKYGAAGASASMPEQNVPPNSGWPEPQPAPTSSNELRANKEAIPPDVPPHPPHEFAATTPYAEQAQASIGQNDAAPSANPQASGYRRVARVKP